jgi:ABC-type transporter Mla MlaB component
VIGLQSKATAVSLDGALTVRCIDTTRASLAVALERHDVVTLDCTAATEIDLSLIQLLLAARASARHAGKTLRLAAPAGGPLRAALHRGGFLTGGADAPAADAAFWLAQDDAAP